ncbi:MAG: hypothetical protein KK482_15680 [Sinorhizobium meliloti]|nr:hypothetical protein [Sinorhizobium meliloti]MCG5485148.1 hypothetical protein [Sinorhizobium meliloti]
MENQSDPQIQIDDMVRVIEEEGTKFRNFCPETIVPLDQGDPGTYLETSMAATRSFSTRLAAVIHRRPRKSGTAHSKDRNMPFETAIQTYFTGMRNEGLYGLLPIGLVLLSFATLLTCAARATPSLCRAESGLALLG